MKKFITAVILILVLASMTGCDGSEDEDTYNSDWQGSLKSSQGIQIKGAKEDVVFATYSEDSEIEGFINELALDQWEPADVPEGAQKEFIAVFYKEDANGNENVVGNITTYKDSTVVSLDSLGLSLAFQMPESALDAIRNAQP